VEIYLIGSKIYPKSKKLSTFKLIIKVIAAIATAVLGVIAGKGLGDED